VTERYVLAGVAPARSAWFQEVARWATAAVLPIEFVKCMSVNESATRLASGRTFSVLLADAATAGLDRDLIDRAATAGCAVFVVDDGRSGRDWIALGASVVLPTDFDRAALLSALTEHAAMIGGPDPVSAGATSPDPTVAWRGRLIAVTGAGGTGTSTVAMALATGLGRETRHRGMVALADLALDADQALLHGSDDVVPGLQELIEAHRAGTPGIEQVRSLLFEGPQPYQLLLGLRRHRDWAVLRPRSFLAAIDSLRRSFTAVVADIDADVEGEAECGSVEVEERNVMARTVADQADLVLVTGGAGVHGVHALVRTIAGFVGHGVAPGRIVPVVNRGPRHARQRAEVTSAVAELTREVVARSRSRPSEVAPVVFLPERRRLDIAVRDVAAVPDQLVDPVTAAVDAVLDRLVDGRFEVAPDEGERVAPGSLGSSDRWTDDEAAG
jgi:hypothetical protein